MRYTYKGVTFLQGPLNSHHDLLHTCYMGLTLPASKDILTLAIKGQQLKMSTAPLSQRLMAVFVLRERVWVCRPKPSNFLDMCIDPSKHIPRYSDGATGQLRAQSYYYLEMAQGVQGFWEDYIL